jgi:hypothetical protein
MRSQYIAPSGVCSRRIGPADAMVIAVAIVWNTTQNTTFSKRLSYFFTSKAISSSTRQALYKHVSKRIKEEAISYISSYQTLTADKNSKTY